MTEPITSDMRRDERTRNYRAVRYGMRLIKFPNEDIPPKSLPLFHMRNRLQHYLSYLGLVIAFIVSGFSGSGEVFGAMVSATEGEKDRGTVSEHVVNGDANYLDDFVTVLGSTPTKPAADLDPKTAARIAKGTELSDGFISVFKNDWGIPSPQFQFDQLKLDLASAGDDLMNFFADKGKNGLKAWEGLFDWEVFRKNPIDLETVSNYYARTGKTAHDFADELFTDQALIRSWLDDQAANIYRFTFNQIDDYVAFATKQGDQSKVMLGMWDGGGSSSYIAKAGTDHTYFDMGSKWDEAVSLVDGGVNDHLDEMWEINKKFLQNEKAGGKEFWFSHDPYSPGNEQFFAREVNWLIDEGVQNFIEVADLWKAVW